MQHSHFQKSTLPSGLRILTEHHSNVHSVTLSIWIVAGSVYEEKGELGLAHLLEHMVFKGTRRRNARQIAAAMDRIGGQMNAFTEREFVCYHNKVLKEHAPQALELLCELLTQPRLDPHDLEIEKGVVLEEINSIEDSPEELVEELFTQTIWSRSRWGRSILGTPQNVAAMQTPDLQGFLQKHYGPKNVLVAAVGDVNHEDFARRVEKLLADLPGEANTKRRAPRNPKVSPHNIQMSRDTEQVHLCCGTRAYSATDPRRFAAWMLDQTLTGGYSSRLFQEIREKRGLCYSIGPMSVAYRPAGFWAVETSVAPETAPRVASLIGRELRRVKADGLSAIELKRAQKMARANILLSEESSSAQMGRIARDELYYGRQRSSAELLADVMGVTLDEVQTVANEMFDAKWMNLTAVGPFDEKSRMLRVDVG